MTDRNDQPTVNLTAPKNGLEVDEAISESQAVANVMPTRRQLGLLDLPPEIRVMIFQELLVYPKTLDFGRWTLNPRPPVAILRTSRLIHREASYVLYRENQFANCSRSLHYSLACFPQVRDTIQNVHLDIAMNSSSFAIQEVLSFQELFGNPSIIRGTLTLCFVIDGDSAHPFECFTQALSQISNFKTIEFYFDGFGTPDQISNLLEYSKTALEPVLGYAEDFSRKRNNLSDFKLKGLRFRPMDHQNRYPIAIGQVLGDVTGVDVFKPPTQDEHKECEASTS